MRVDSSSESPRHQRAGVYAPTAQTPLETISEMQRMSKCSWDLRCSWAEQGSNSTGHSPVSCSRLFQDDEWKSYSTPRRNMPSRIDQFDLYIHMYIYNIYIRRPRPMARGSASGQRSSEEQQQQQHQHNNNKDRLDSNFRSSSSKLGNVLRSFSLLTELSLGLLWTQAASLGQKKERAGNVDCPSFG